MSVVAEIEIVLHNYAAQFTDQDLLDAIVYVACPFCTPDAIRLHTTHP
jgi:hypothetical protein